jgi:EmrB/QacA subfamily drug resistance transporter
VAKGYRVVALTVSTALFMQFLDSTALNVAIPAMARDLHVPAIDLNIAILAYQLSMTVLIPVGSVLVERVGQRNAFAIALLVFMVGSILCAISTSLPALVASRALQGAGGAVMTPVSRLLVVRSADKSELLNAMNWLLLPGIVGPMMGPVIGGQLVTYSSWHWIFLINVPVALLGIVMTLIIVPDVRDSAKGNVDIKGIMLVGPAIFALVFGLESAAHPGAAWKALCLLVAAAVLFWLFIRHVRTAASPVLDLTLLSVASFRHSIVSGSIYRTLAMANGFIMPLWLQLGMGMSAAKAGAILVVSSIGTIASRLAGVHITRMIHPRTVAIGGAVLLVFALLATSRLETDWPLPVFYSLLGFQAIVLSLSMMVVSASAYVDIEAERVAQAAGLFTTIQQVTMSLGVTLGVWLISGMRLFYGTSEHDSRIYSASLVILALIAVAGVNSTRKLDVHSTGMLQGDRKRQV